MDVYVNSISSTTVLAPHHVSSTQNSLQGALKNDSDLVRRTPSTLSKSPGNASTVVVEEKDGSLGHLNISLDQDMQRQLEEYNRLQHMNPTFPYFQLQQLSTLATDLGLTPGSYIDAYDPSTGKWEQHTTNTVRLVVKQQRLLYKTRRNLLDGLDERHCLGLHEEVQTQSKPPSFQALKLETQNSNGSTKRPLPEGTSTGQAHKVHIPNTYYAPRTALPSTGSEPLPQSPSDVPVLHNVEHTPTTPSAPSNNNTYPYQQPPVFYQQSPTANTSPASGSASTSEATLPPHLTNVDPNPPPIPYHPHPPLKRWPNDYTVSELTSGFNAMELLIRQPPDGTTITQRTAFERVFGSRYVKSTVCRHRGLWRKAKGALREQFEAMGVDERACWGEFVRRIEGRPPSKSSSHGTDTLPSPSPPQGVVIYPGHGNIGVGGLHPSVDAIQGQVLQRRTEDKNVVEEPVMASLQNPDEQDVSLSNSQF